jgi:serine/threonine protein kinase
VTTAKHRKTGSKYALKSIAIGTARSTTSLDEFLQEIDIHKSLDHPNIARLQVATASIDRAYELYIYYSFVLYRYMLSATIALAC